MRMDQGDDTNWTGKRKRKEFEEPPLSILEEFQSPQIECQTPPPGPWQDTITVWKRPSHIEQTLPNSPSSVYIYFDPLLERFIDNFAPDPVGSDSALSLITPTLANNGHFSYGTSSALRVCGEICGYSPILRHALIAASTLYFGYEIGERAIVQRSSELFGIVLNHLRAALGNTEQARTSSVLGTVLVAMAYESMRSTDGRALLAHCKGALHLIEFRGPYSHKYGIEHIIFKEILPHFISAAITFRQPTFLSQQDWKTIPWSGSGSKKDIMDALMCHMADLPGLLHYADLIASHSPKTSRYSSPTFIAKQQKQWAAISSLELGLQDWKETWADQYGTVIEQDFPSLEPFPDFQQRLSSGEIITPRPLIYPDPQLCRCLGYYYAAMILLYSIDTRPTSTPSPNPHPASYPSYEQSHFPSSSPPSDQSTSLRSKQQLQYYFACMICRSMKYFSDAVPGNMVARMLLPIMVASAAFPPGGVENYFVKKVVDIIQSKRSLNSWSQWMENAGRNYRVSGN